MILLYKKKTIQYNPLNNVFVLIVEIDERYEYSIFQRIIQSIYMTNGIDNAYLYKFVYI